MSGQLRFLRALPLAAAMLSLAPLKQVAHAISISIEYSTDFGGDESPAWDSNGAILISHFQAAKQIWEALLPGPGSFQFDFQWDNDIGSETLGLTTDLGALDVFIEINPNWNWYADPTPGDDAEFDLSNGQTLYGQLSLANRSYFPGTTPPDSLEVGYRGSGLANYSTGAPTASGSGVAGVNANNGQDLLSTIVHEIGHVLGISGEEPGDFNILPQHVGGLNNVLVQEDEGGGHLAGHGDVPFLMCESCGVAGVRRLPSATDILVVAEDEGIPNVHLNRVGSVASGLWSDANLWIGGDVPDVNQDAYIYHNGTTTLNANQQVRGLRVMSGNSVAVDGNQLSVKGALTFQGGTISVAAGGMIAADSISDSTAISATPPGTLVTTAGSLVRFNSYNSAISSSANFNGSVSIGYDKLATLTIPSPVFTPNSIATWNIAEQLAIGDSTATAKLVISAGVDFQSATGAIGSSNAGGGLGHVDLTDSGSTWTTGAFDARKGTLNVLNKGELTTAATNVGSSPSGGFFTATVDDALWNVNGNIVVGPTTPTGATGRTLTLKNLGQMIVTGNLNVRGTSSVNSEVIVESGGNLQVVGQYTVSPYGKITYRDNTDADNKTYTNLGTAEENRLGGTTQFEDHASAGNSNLINNGGTAIFGGGGVTRFNDDSTAEFATITNLGPSGLYAYVGKTIFNGSSSAGFSNITTDFYNTSDAGSATITNKSGPYNTLAGITTFHDSSSAGDGTFINDSALSGNNGEFVFKDFSTAGNGNFTSGSFGGFVTFNNNSNAGEASFTLRSSANCRVNFYGSSSASNATFEVGPLTYPPTNASNDVNFYQSSTAGNATMTIRGDGGRVIFAGGTAGASTLTVLGSTRPGNVPGTVAGQALIDFLGSAGNATITAQPSTVAGAPGGLIQFQNSGHAGAATLIANGGASAINGGLIRFGSGATGGSARLVVNAGANADFSLNIFYTGTEVGSIEGAGKFYLGGSLLTVGNRNTSTAVSGSIADLGGYRDATGGRLTKVGTGTFTLSGANNYSGLTTVAEGTLVVDGSIAGAVLVKNGGRLQGVGGMGNVVVEMGGVIGPGNSPGTMTMGGLHLMNGSTLTYELGALRDRIVVTNNGSITLGGVLDLSILAGFNPLPGQTFELFEGAIGSITGTFSAVNAPVFNGHTLDLVYDYLAKQVRIEVIDALGIPGDYNQNGSVDAADYTVYRDALGTNIILPNDSTPGSVTAADYLVWQNNFSGGASATNAATVPEPHLTAIISIMLLVIALSRFPRCRLLTKLTTR